MMKFYVCTWLIVGICGSLWAGEAGEKFPAQAAIRFPSLRIRFEQESPGSPVKPGLWVTGEVGVHPSFTFRGNEPQVQYLEAIDSEGKKLAPVKVETDHYFGLMHRGLECFYFEGNFQEFPSHGAEWIALKGVLSFAVVRREEGPCSRLPLKHEAETWIPLQQETEQEADIDITVAEQPMGRLVLDEMRHLEGGKLEVKLILFSPPPFCLDKIFLLDEEGTPLKTEVKSDISAGGEGMPGYGKVLILDDREGLQHLNVKVRYTGAPERITVPVDTRVSLSGEIKGKK